MARGRNSGARKETTGRSSPETTERKVTKLLVTGQCRKLVQVVFATTNSLGREFCSEIFPAKKILSPHPHEHSRFAINQGTCREVAGKFRSKDFCSATYK